MTTDPTLSRIIERWLDDGPTDIPDRVVDAVARRITDERQRPAWRLQSWRPLTMPVPLRLAALAAALLAVVIGGTILFSGGAGPGPAPSATPSASPSASPTASPAYDWPTTLSAGTYTTRTIWDTPFEWRFTIPDGWQSRDVEVFSDTTTLAFHLVGDTYSDTCASVAQDPPTGPTAEDLSIALAALPGFDATEPSVVSAAGVTDGRYLELSVRDDAACESPAMWADPEDSYNGDGPVGPPSWGAEMPNMRLWILEVDGERLVVSALWTDTATEADLDELQAVVDSFRIVPATGEPIALPSPG